MPQRFPILFVTDRTIVSGYKKPGGGGGGNIDLPQRSPQAHGEHLRGQLNEVFKEFDDEQLQRKQDGKEIGLGVKVTFSSSPGFLLKWKSLEALNKGIRLLTMKEVAPPDGEASYMEATVFIPSGEETYFLKKVQDYLQSENGKTNRPLIDSINQIQRTLLENIWQDQVAPPPGEAAQWCECWVRLDYNKGKIKVEQELKDRCALYDIELAQEMLSFPERRVYLLKANYAQLTELLMSYDYLAELRKAREPVSFWIREPAEQGEYAEKLRERVTVQDDQTCAF